MKKLLVSLGLLASIGTASVAAGTDLFISDMEYYWDVNKKLARKHHLMLKNLL